MLIHYPLQLEDNANESWLSENGASVPPEANYDQMSDSSQGKQEQLSIAYGILIYWHSL